MAELLETYDDASLPTIVQPLYWSTPWSVLPKADDFDASVSNNAYIPVIDWQWQFWEDDLRADLTQYLTNVIGMTIGDGIKDLPGLYLTSVYRNVFQNNQVLSSAALMPRIDNELISTPNAVAPLWVAYWIAMYMQDQLNQGTVSPESKYRIKMVMGIAKAVSFVLNQHLSSNPTINRGERLIVCNTKSTVERIILFVDRDYLSDYLDAGKTLNELGVNFFNSGANPKKGTDF